MLRNKNETPSCSYSLHVLAISSGSCRRRFNKFVARTCHSGRPFRAWKNLPASLNSLSLVSPAKAELPMRLRPQACGSYRVLAFNRIRPKQLCVAPCVWQILPSPGGDFRMTASVDVGQQKRNALLLLFSPRFGHFIRPAQGWPVENLGLARRFLGN